MTALRTDIQDVLFDAILPAVALRGLTDQQLVWSDQPTGDGSQSAPQPDTPYVSMKIISGPRRAGNDDEIRMPEQSSPRVDAELKGRRLFTLGVQAYGAGAGDIVQTLVNYLQLPTVNATARRSQLATLEVLVADPSSTYTLTVGHELVEITTGLAPTLETIRDGLVAAVDLLDGITVTALPAPAEFTIEGPLGESLYIAVEARLQIVDNIEGVDIVFQSDNGETNLSDIIDGSHFEDRSSIDFFCSTTTVFNDLDVGVIETTEGSGEVDNYQMTFGG